MQWHYLVLLVGVAVTVTYGYPFEKDDTTSLEESFADGEDKKDEVNNVDEAEVTGEKKASIAKTDEDEDADATEETDADEETGKKDASVTDYDDDVVGEDVAKKDDVKPATTKEETAKANKAGAKEAPKAAAAAKEETKKRDEHHHRHQLEKKTNAAKKGEDQSKKWWMVEGPHKWGGMGHSHWGPPHNSETQNEHHENEHQKESEHEAEGGEGESKSHVPACCKLKDHNARKRCGCAGVRDGGHNNGGRHQKVKEHEGGYHFHDKGDSHEHNNDHDHNLRGPWTFGYDGFGDDWGDWDHNHGRFEHLKDLEKNSHGGHHEYHGDGDHEGHGEHDNHDCDSKRDCLEEDMAAPPTPPIIGPIEAPAAEYPMPLSLVSLPPPAVVQAHALPYRVCHSCHLLRDGGSRCLCKAINHHHGHHHAPHHAKTHFNHHVYIDCDAAVHNFPNKETICFPKHKVPKPESAKTTSGEAKQGVVYPYVGYGPWAAYPWWGDWWGGHGNHGWANNGCGDSKGEHEDKSECDCGGCGGCGGKHHDKNEVEIDHGRGIVHHNHNGDGDEHGGHDNGCDHDCGKRCHGIGYSFRPSSPAAYRCHDIMENQNDDPSLRSKRFCVPVGNNGGYGWPYWHGYPGVGTGLWGWGWPWIKNKVPGSKGNKTKTADTKQAAAAAPAAAPAPTDSKSPNRRSNIVGSSVKGRKTKKQTIHMGYGYVSGDNYRLGFGFGGMGGVQEDRNEVTEPGLRSPFSRSRIESDYRMPVERKMKIPTPEKVVTVTGIRRGIDGLHHVGHSMRAEGRRHSHKAGGFRNRK